MGDIAATKSCGQKDIFLYLPLDWEGALRSESARFIAYVFQDVTSEGDISAAMYFRVIVYRTDLASSWF